MRPFLLVASFVLGTLGNSLIDHPIAGAKVTYLDGTWTLESPTAAIKTTGQVPGDLITDLQRNGYIGDPLYELNFLKHTLWTNHTWTYSTTFTVDLANDNTHLLVLDGIKMGASITLNGHQLGLAVDQFLRYEFEVEQYLVNGTNTLEVKFDWNLDVNGRFMACTGGWDWAPYSGTKQGDANTFSQGIWKSVYLVKVEAMAIKHVVPQIFYQGDYPTEKLEDGSHGGFKVVIRVHTWAPKPVYGTLSVDAGFSNQFQTFTFPSGDFVLNFTLTAPGNTNLWWPTGYGPQFLYNLTARFDASDATPVETERKIGLRTFALVTGNDTNPEYVKKNKDADGNDDQGMLWRVNGMVIFSRGANMIPMEELEGRFDEDGYKQLVKSARDGGFNTLRVWGGGIFLPRVWYDACDELGIMVYHDMAYAQRGHSPNADATEDAELRYQIRRLSNHPSIVMYDGCNECKVIIGTPTGIYATFVMTVVAEEDQSRVVWPSCPATGWKNGVNRLTGLPNGSPQGLLPATSQGAAPAPTKGPIETHGPYQHGTGFPSVDGANDLQPFSPNIPINISPSLTGPQYYNTYASEFGCVVMSSFESMSVTLAPEHWSVHGGAPWDKCNGYDCEGGNVMAQRNYACDSIIYAYFGYNQDLNATGEAVFKKQLYQCMLGQALEMKSNIETRRATNQFGILVWQYNEIWPTGGWGSIEYSGQGKGQVIGGRWKPLHYFYKNHLFTDITVACSRTVCYVKNDSPDPFKGKVLIELLDLETGKTSSFLEKSLSMPRGAGVTQFFDIDTSKVDGRKTVLLAQVQDDKQNKACSNTILFATPANLTLQDATVQANVSGTINQDGTVDILVSSDKAAAFVVLTTLAQGRFSDNAFFLAASQQQTITFIPFKGFKLDELQRSLRVEHLAQMQ